MTSSLRMTSTPMNRIWTGAVLCAALLACSPPRPQPAATPTPSAPRPALAQVQVPLASDSAAVAFLIEEGTRRSHAAADLRYLTDVVGPRLTGSPGARRANER